MRKFTLLLTLCCILATSYAQDISIELFASGFNSPVDLQNAGDSRLFVVEQAGRIRILNADGTINSTPFLDIDSSVNSGGERGLLGLAFHPDYATNGYFYVYYTDLSNDTQISRFSVSSGDPDIADAGSELKMLDFDQPFTNHNGGSLQFGPDGMLYIGSGDGGSGGDPGNRAQNLTTYLGKILRLDVDAAAPYIPADNPYVSDSSALDEIWAYGIRNPWRFSFDALTGDLWIADVGQSSREEINKEDPTAAPLNYGWRCYEGNAPFNTSGCPDVSTLTFPAAEYSHGGGRCSITGGYVYRGSAYNAIEGLYFFADICTGEIGTVDSSDNLTWVLDTAQSWSAFGEDVNNELYGVSLGGGIYTIVGTIIGVDEFESEQNITWYQDSANNTIEFETTNTIIQELNVFQINGVKALTLDNVNANTLSVSTSGLATGLYIAQLKDTNGSPYTIKIAIQ